MTYWYGVNSPTLVKTDELKIGDIESEKAHRYVSPDASEPYEITSRYEWGVDTLNGKEIYPAHADVGRKTTGESEFTLKLTPDNFGVLLRRKLDYSFPNQRAEVYIGNPRAAGYRKDASASDDFHEHEAEQRAADISPSPGGEGRGEGERSPDPILALGNRGAGKSPDRRAESDWRFAGIWYLAGANTCVYSNPKEELGDTQHIVQTSNRRFRDDEFIIPRELTRGRSAIRVRVKFTPVKIPLFPGQPLPELALSEIRYDAYCWVMPPARAKR